MQWEQTWNEHLEEAHLHLGEKPESGLCWSQCMHGLEVIFGVRVERKASYVHKQ